MRKFFFLLFAISFWLKNGFAQCNKGDRFILNNIEFFKFKMLEDDSNRYSLKKINVKIDSNRILSRYLTSSVNVANKAFDVDGNIKIQHPLIKKKKKYCKKASQNKDTIFLNIYPELKFKGYKFKMYTLRYESWGLEILTIMDNNEKIISLFDIGYIE